MKTIKARIARFTIILVIISSLLIGGISILLNYTSTNRLLEQTMLETAVLASERVSKELKQYEIIAVESGTVARLCDTSTSVAAKKEIIDKKAESHGLQRGNILGLDGKSIFDGNDYSQRAYFQEAVKGNTYISEPLVSQVSGELTIIVAAPMWENGVPDTKVIGVVYYVPTETFLNDIMNSIKISKNSSAYMISKGGTTIAHQDIERVKNYENVEELAAEEPKLSALASIHEQMRNGKTDFSQYEFSGVEKFIAYAPVEETDGWSIGVTAPTDDFMKATINSIWITIVLLILSCIVAVSTGLIAGKKIADPISQCASRLAKLAEGDLHTEIPEIHTKDETKKLADATQQIVTTTSSIIKDIGWGLGVMAQGDFTVDSQVKHLYVGDFIPLATAMYGVQNTLTNTLSEIDEVANQVASGSNQVADGAQASSQGATEQAASVEELAATISDISDQINGTTKNLASARDTADSVGGDTEQCNSHMKDMLHAMNDISQSSSQIGKIIKTIEDIAFQTNILALNAAVEAARAGSAGKGFAVVADEVRNLASKSAEASKNTSGLIEGSIHAVERGTHIANETAQSLEQVVIKNREVTDLVDRIADDAKLQAASIMQVTQAVDQISSVVQTTSATAEESAAASEELSGQAQVMKDLVGRFTLHKKNS